MKICSVCKHTKPVDCFAMNGPKYRRSNCRECARIKRLKNVDLYRSRCRESYRRKVVTDEDRAKRKEYRLNFKMKHPHYYAEISRIKRKNYPAIHAAQQRTRYAAKFKATPSWLTTVQKAQILEFYEIATSKSFQTGIDHHVDHIVPLRGESVSGLHVPWNLQVITAYMNRTKKNNMPEVI